MNHENEITFIEKLIKKTNISLERAHTRSGTTSEELRNLENKTEILRNIKSKLES